MAGKTMKFGDKEYTLVPERLKQMREDNPRASIETEPTYNADGSITFKATIIRDMADESSARATGNARYTAEELKKAKSFEKLETISVGRALANLGYLNDGQIASTEELEEFHDYKMSRAMEAIEEIKKIGDLQELKKYFLSLGSLGSQKEVWDAKEAKKKELS